MEGSRLSSMSSKNLLCKTGSVVGSRLGRRSLMLGKDEATKEYGRTWLERIGATKKPQEHFEFYEQALKSKINLNIYVLSKIY